MRAEIEHSTFFSSSPQNLIAQSQSGTGKTAAFVLAMLSHVDPENKWPQVWNASESVDEMHANNCAVLVLMSLFLFAQCLCVSPTYELALQTGKVIEQMGKFYPEVQLVYAIRGNKCKCFYFRNQGFLWLFNNTLSGLCTLLHIFLTFRIVIVDPILGLRNIYQNRVDIVICFIAIVKSCRLRFN